MNNCCRNGIIRGGEFKQEEAARQICQTQRPRQSIKNPRIRTPKGMRRLFNYQTIGIYQDTRCRLQRDIRSKKCFCATEKPCKLVSKGLARSDYTIPIRTLPCHRTQISHWQDEPGTEELQKIGWRQLLRYQKF